MKLNSGVYKEEGPMAAALLGLGLLSVGATLHMFELGLCSYESHSRVPLVM